MSQKFKIGDIVKCARVDDFYSDRLIIGKDYEISDMDIHFPNKIVVRLDGPVYYHSEFIPEDFFMYSLSTKRENKINKILK
jgi:hypothetical protein